MRKSLNSASKTHPESDFLPPGCCHPPTCRHVCLDLCTSLLLISCLLPHCPPPARQSGPVFMSNPAVAPRCMEDKNQSSNNGLRGPPWLEPVTSPTCLLLCPHSHYGLLLPTHENPRELLPQAFPLAVSSTWNAFLKDSCTACSSPSRSLLKCCLQETHLDHICNLSPHAPDLPHLSVFFPQYLQPSIIYLFIIFMHKMIHESKNCVSFLSLTNTHL